MARGTITLHTGGRAAGPGPVHGNGSRVRFFVCGRVLWRGLACSSVASLWSALPSREAAEDLPWVAVGSSALQGERIVNEEALTTAFSRVSF